MLRLNVIDEFDDERYALKIKCLEKIQIHYCLNENVNGTGAENHPVRLASIAEPTVIVWLFDTKNLPAVGGWSFVHTNLHNAGAQFAFLDGHARRFHNTEYWSFTTNHARLDNPQLRWIP